MVHLKKKLSGYMALRMRSAAGRKNGEIKKEIKNERQMPVTGKKEYKGNTKYPCALDCVLTDRDHRDIHIHTHKCASTYTHIL